MTETMELVASLGQILGIQEPRSLEGSIDALPAALPLSDGNCRSLSESQQVPWNPVRGAPEEPRQAVGAPTRHQGLHVEPILSPSPDGWEDLSPELLTQRVLQIGNGLFSCSECVQNSCQSHPPLNQPEKQSVTWDEYMNSFDWLTHLQMDLGNHTGEKLFTCTECEESFFQITDLKLHKTLHAREKLCMCPECGKGFRGNQALKAHRRSHRATQRFPCTDCGESFSHMTDFRAHQRVHARERIYTCPECGKFFRRVQAFAVHKRSHRTEKHFSCAVCAESFHHAKDLRKHQEGRSVRKVFPCTECGKHFTGNQALGKHTGKSPFLHPDGCGNSFTYKHDLVLYEGTHAGERPFADAHCDRYHLVSYEGGPTGEKPIAGAQYDDSICGMMDLVGCQKNRERQFLCKECGRGYIRKRDLTVHLKIHARTALEKAAKEVSPADRQNDFSSLHENLLVSTAFLQDLISSTSTFQYD